VVAHTFHDAFVVIKFAGAAYLLYLAYRMWTAPAEAKAITVVFKQRSQRQSCFLTGLSVTLGNPKAAGFYLSRCCRNLIDLGNVDLLGYAELAGLCIAALTLVLGGLCADLRRVARRSVHQPARRSSVQTARGGALMGRARPFAVASK